METIDLHTGEGTGVVGRETLPGVNGLAFGSNLNFLMLLNMYHQYMYTIKKK